MSSTTQVTTFSDLYTDLLNRVRSSTGTTTQDTQAKRYINTALQDMHVGFAEKVPWAERTARFVTQPAYSTGTVSIPQGSTSLAGTSTLWTTTNAFGVANARAGGRVVINGGREVYDVVSVDDASTITLSARFVGDDVTDGTYQYFEDTYALADDFLRTLDANFFDSSRQIQLLDRRTFYLRHAIRRTPGRPHFSTIVDEAPSGNTTPVRKVIFDVPSQDAALCEYRYVTAYLATSAAGVAQTGLSADTDEPIVPLRFRHAIVLHALYNWYRDKKDDRRSREAKQEYTDMMVRLAADTETGQQRARMVPVVGPYKASARRPWRGRGSRRYTAGSAFDEMRD